MSDSESDLEKEWTHAMTERQDEIRKQLIDVLMGNREEDHILYSVQRDSIADFSSSSFFCEVRN